MKEKDGIVNQRNPNTVYFSLSGRKYNKSVYSCDTKKNLTVTTCKSNIGKCMENWGEKLDPTSRLSEKVITEVRADGFVLLTIT